MINIFGHSFVVHLIGDLRCIHDFWASWIFCDWGGYTIRWK